MVARTTRIGGSRPRFNNFAMLAAMLIGWTLLIGPQPARGDGQESLLSVPLNPVVHYSFENPGNLGFDSSGNGYHATVFGPAAQAGGVFGSGLRLDNSGVTNQQFLQLPNAVSTDGNFAGQAATLAMWIRLVEATPAAPRQTGIDRLGTAGSTAHYPWTNGQAYLSTFRNTRVETINLLGSVDRTQFHHLAITSDASGWRLYQDGQLVTGPLAQLWGFPASNLRIGAHAGVTFGSPTVNDRLLNGWIDEVMLFNEALTPEQLSNLILFNQTAPPPPLAPEPAAWALFALALVAIVGSRRLIRRR